MKQNCKNCYYFRIKSDTHGICDSKEINEGNLIQGSASLLSSIIRNNILDWQECLSVTGNEEEAMRELNREVHAFRVSEDFGCIFFKEDTK
jgi:transcriptional antiterminator Rof (Rho-off)